MKFLGRCSVKFLGGCSVQFLGGSSVQKVETSMQYVVQKGFVKEDLYFFQLLILQFLGVFTVYCSVYKVKISVQYFE